LQKRPKALGSTKKENQQGMTAMITTGEITQAELERLLDDSRRIAEDWESYLQFRANRDAILSQLRPVEGLN